MFKSCAQWPDDVYSDPSGLHVTRDSHTTREQAAGVCRLLEREGFGGDGKRFPIKVWVEPENA